jgi:Family of unknown function (DUF5317)
MVGLIAPALLVALGLLLAGRSDQTSFSVRWWPLGAAALAVQLILFNHPLDQQAWAIAWGPAIYLTTMLVVASVLLANGLRAMAANWPWLIAALGVGLNILVVSANGGYMPQSVDAREAAGRNKDRPEATAAQLTNITPLTDDSRLPFLGDVIAEPAWFPMANVISLGDLLLSFGVAGAFLATPAFARRRQTALVGVTD